MDANRASVCPVPETQKPSAPVTITYKTAWGSDEVSQTTAFCGVGKLAFFHKRRREEVFTQAQSRKEQSFLFQRTTRHAGACDQAWDFGLRGIRPKVQNGMRTANNEARQCVRPSHDFRPDDPESVPTPPLDDSSRSARSENEAARKGYAVKSAKVKSCT